MRPIRSALAGIVFASGISLTAAQSGGITVKVLDATGPLPGATVTIRQDSGYVKTTSALANKYGIVEFPVLRAGHGYSLEVSFPGLGTRRIDELAVRINLVQEYAIQLAEEVIERVKVAVEGDVVDLEKVSTSTRFSDEFIQDLPVQGRFYQNILPLTPGVQDADGDGNPNVHGSRARDFKALVSGISNVDPLTGQQGMQINPNSIEEMEVITAGAGVEFSRAQGGFARIIQKQGSNELEGVFEFYYRTSRFDGEGAGDDSNLPAPSFEWIQPAFQLSGPIVRDRLWYRFSHELIRNERPVNTTRGIVIQNNDLGVHADQITWQLSPRNKLAFQYQSDPLDIDNFGVSSLTPAESSQRRRKEGETWSLTWTAPYSPKVLVESRVAWQDLTFGISPSTSGVPNDCIRGDDVLEILEQAQCFHAGINAVSGSYFRTWDDHSQRLTVGSDATLYAGRLWGASHRLKVGLVVENERYFRHLERRPDMQFFPFWIVETDSSGNLLSRDRYADLTVNIAAPQSDDVSAKGIAWGIYAEDQIKPLQNLTVSVGLRLDREEIRSEGHRPIDFEAESQEFLRLIGPEVGLSPALAQKQAFTAYESLGDFSAELARVLDMSPLEVFTNLSHAAQAGQNWPRKRRHDDIAINNTNASPFLSFSWDPWSDGKTKIAATARRYYDKIFLGIPLIELEPATTTLVFLARQVSRENWVVEDITGDIDPAANVSVVDRELKTPYNDELSFTFERELWPETSLGVTYVNRRFRDQFQDFDINHLPGDFGRCRRPDRNSRALVAPLTPGDPDYVPGGGDGTIDDCSGILLRMGGTPLEPNNPFRWRRPDGIPDLYVQNPGWGDVLLVGNFNEIDYEAVVVQLTRRQYRNWEMQASYTWSRAEGDGEDFQQELGDDRSLLPDEVGPQSYDQRHVVKLNATTITPWGFRLGSAVSWQSGLPYSRVVDRLSYYQSIPQYGTLSSATQGRRRRQFANGQRNDERNRSFWNVDVKLTKEMNLGQSLNLQVSAEVFNLLNDGTLIIFDPITDSGLQINGTNVATRRFGRRWQIGVKLQF